MKIKTAIFYVLLALVLVACEDTTTTVISETSGVTSFYVISKFSSTVEDFTFTIDTVSRVIYNEDSLDFGTRVDSLAPVMYPIFVTAMIDDSISLYESDTVYVDFTNPRRLTVKTSTGDTAVYTITVNVHKVDPDSFVWRKSFDLGDGEIGKQGSVMTEDGKMYWLRKINGQWEMYSSMDGGSWIEQSVQGLPTTVDAEHLIVHEGKLCVLSFNDLYIFDGSKWTKSEATSSVTLRHLLMSFNGDLYALGDGNVIMKLNRTLWKTAAQMDSGFPVKGESAFVGWSIHGIKMAYVAFGIDENGNYLQDVWSTEDGSYWVKLTEKKNALSCRAYAMVRQYGSGLLSLGGTNGDSIVSDNFMFSKDYGITWENGDTLYNLDTAVVRSYAIRYGGSMMVDKNSGYVYVVGGKDSLNVVKGDVWRGLHYADIPGFEK